MKEKEHILRCISVLRVEHLYSRGGSSEDFFIPLPMFCRRVGEITQNRELQIRIAVRQILYFEMLQGFLDGAHASQ